MFIDFFHSALPICLTPFLTTHAAFHLRIFVQLFQRLGGPP